MSWERLKKRSGRSRDPDSVGFSVGRFVTFSLGEDLRRRLGWEAGHRIEIVIGRAGDAGKVRLISGGRGRADYKLMFNRSGQGERAILRPLAWAGLVKRFDMQDAPYIEITGGIEITLPVEALAPNAARPVVIKATLAATPATANAARTIETGSFIKPPSRDQLMGRR